MHVYRNGIIVASRVCMVQKCKDAIDVKNNSFETVQGNAEISGAAGDDGGGCGGASETDETRNYITPGLRERRERERDTKKSTHKCGISAIFFFVFQFFFHTVYDDEIE